MNSSLSLYLFLTQQKVIMDSLMHYFTIRKMKVYYPGNNADLLSARQFSSNINYNSAKMHPFTNQIFKYKYLLKTKYPFDPNILILQE